MTDKQTNDYTMLETSDYAPGTIINLDDATNTVLIVGFDEFMRSYKTMLAQALSEHFVNYLSEGAK